MTPIWASTPPAGKAADYEFHKSFSYALRERHYLLAQNTHYPSSSNVYARGSLTSIVDNGDGTLKITVVDENGDDPAWADNRWYNFNAPDDIPFLAGFYKIAIFPPDGCAPLVLSDHNKGRVIEIQLGNGSNWINVSNDGHLTLNGLALADYVGWEFEIIRSSTNAMKGGYSWIQMLPPRPNEPELDYGLVDADATATLTLNGGPTSGSYTFTIVSTAGTHTTDPIPFDADAAAVQVAIRALAGLGAVIVVAGAAPNIMIATFPGSLRPVGITAGVGGLGGGTSPSFTIAIRQATTTTIADTRQAASDGWETPKDFSSRIWKEVTCSVGGVWYRRTITATSTNPPDQLTLNPALPGIPDGNYYIVKVGAWWRKEFAISLGKVIGREGTIWVKDGPYGFSPQRWYHSFAITALTSHSPADDSIQLYAMPAASFEIQFAGSPGVSPEPLEIRAFDNIGFPSEFVNYTGGDAYSDLNPNAFFLWTIRGYQNHLRSFPQNFTERGDKSAKTHIVPFSFATWWKKYKAANTITTTITAAVDGSPTATIAIAMPTKTTIAGAHSTLEGFVSIMSGDQVLSERPATITAASVTMHPVSDADDPRFFTGDVGKTIVLTFMETRFYERRFMRLYPRSVFVGSDAEHTTPTMEFPGEYITEEPSTNYAEYSDRGQLSETGDAFVEGESARYVAQNFDDPTNPGALPEGSQYDKLYQGLAHQVTNGAPYWEASGREGTITSAGPFWFDDVSKVWWCASTPAVTHTGVATAGDTLTLTDATKNDPANNYWNGSTSRWIRLILEVSFDGELTWERRPIIAYNAATQTITVGIAFSANTNGKPYRIREPGNNGGAIFNLWRGIPVVVTKADGSASGRTLAQYSDDTRVYFATGALGFTPAAGDKYKFDVIEPGTVLQRKAADTHAVSGWVRPEYAVADARAGGTPWHLGASGACENLPTMVKSYGLFRKRDVIGNHLYSEWFAGINVLAALIKGLGWSAKGELNDKKPLPTIADGSTCALAKSEAEGEWDDDTTWGDFTLSSANLPPSATSGTGYPGGQAPYSAGITRRYSYAQVDTPHVCIGGTVNMYVWAIADPDDHDDGYVFTGVAGDGSTVKHTIDFDANGDPVVWHHWHSIANLPAVPGGITEYRMGAASIIGSAGKPNWAACPDHPAYDYATAYKGYNISQSIAVEDFAAELTYIA